MASIGLFEASISLFCFLIFYYFFIKKNCGYLLIKKTLQSYAWNWPVLGMLPALFVWHNGIDDIIWFIEKKNLTFLFKGPWFTRMDALITVDPANIHHIFSSNFSNYIKGSDFNEIFDVFGDAIFNTDSELWKNQRMTCFSLFSIAIQRKGQSWTCRIEEIRSQGFDHDHSNGESEDLLTSHIKLDTSKYELLKPNDDKFLRDTILTFIAAGRDTISTALTWFFGLLLKHPYVEAKIHQEINTNLPKSRSSQERPWSAIDRKAYLNKLVYLHGALCEAMRLYPPVPFQRKSPIKSDVLPSGHKVDANSIIIIPIYVLGRMRSVWGDDTLEFKPERWISETGGLRHEPSFKFLAFNSGPRTCPGKHLAMTSMKAIIVEILQHYDVKLIEGQKIEPKPRLVLQMNHGLRVTLTKKYSS
ncbi:hypothetical protein HID58_061602 [Brassica napus]|uniref:Cytochrome P450 n=1 Tax=Brassica napus TaxID=3708 RepID=A0ABQ7ZZ18_BRANA|nr:hypothetical protein HID58_061602 [Brassica napus]